jgi:ubiquinone/menaquinone biosynthesis C-methylase UbiE
MLIKSCLRCPTCRKSGGLPVTINVANTSLTCQLCGFSVACHDGIPDFADDIPKNDPNISNAQKIMNTPFFSSLYETPFWRPLHTFIGSGISWRAEIRMIMDMVKNQNPLVIADVACGTGHYARAYAKQFPEARIYALDISFSMLSNGQKIATHSSVQSISFLRGDIYRLPFDDSSVDIVNCSGALHLFPDISPIFEEISRVLKPGGMFTAMTIAQSTGILGNLQNKLVNDRKAFFFNPDLLPNKLKIYGFNQFTYVQKKVVLLFSVNKRGCFSF